MFLFFFIGSRNTTQGEAGDQQMNSHTDPVHTTSVHLCYSSKVVRKCVNEAFSQLALSEVLARLQVINLLFTYRHTHAISVLMDGTSFCFTLATNKIRGGANGVSAPPAKCYSITFKKVISTVQVGPSTEIPQIKE